MIEILHTHHPDNTFHMQKFFILTDYNIMYKEIDEKYISIKCQSSFIKRKKNKKLEIKLIYYQKLWRITYKYKKNSNKIYANCRRQPCTHYMQILCKRFAQISNEIFMRCGFRI